MTMRCPTRRRPRIVGVIASRADLDRALQIRRPPDLFELRLDCLTGAEDQLQDIVTKLRVPLIMTFRHTEEGGAKKLSQRERCNLLTRFLDHADYLDVELHSVSRLRSLLEIAETKKIKRIISFHNFKSTPSAQTLAVKARKAKAHHADIFKVATRTDSPVELGRLLDFMSNSSLKVPLAVMGIGKLGSISRLLLARAGSVLVYASLCTTIAEGQLSVDQLRAAGIGSTAKRQ